jgi:excisionase family DNA binding protein
VNPGDPRALSYLLTPDEVALLLRTTRKAVYSRIERGLLPGVVRDGRRVLLLRDDVLRYIAERRAASPGDRR